MATRILNPAALRKVIAAERKSAAKQSVEKKTTPSLSAVSNLAAGSESPLNPADLATRTFASFAS